jgi:oxygen-dependent protoporphyrinogen oxidase
VEWGPNSFQPAPSALRLIDEAALWDELLPAATNSPRYIYVNGSLKKFPFGPLSFGGIARVLREPLVWSKSPQDESVRDFFTRRFGKQAHDHLVGPLLTGIYAADSSQLSMAAVFPKILETERQHGSLITAFLRSFTKKSSSSSSSQTTRPKPKGSVFSFPQGMETLPRRIAENLTIKYGVSGAAAGDSPVTVLAVPACQAAEIVESDHAALAALLRKVRYSPMVVAASAVPEDAFDPPLKGFGFLAARSEGLHILGTLFSSALFADRAPQGQVLLTSFLGGAFEPEALDWPDERVWATAWRELQRVLKTTSADFEPIALVRHRNAIPQYNVGHERWVQAVQDELRNSPGLFIASNYLDSVSVPGCIERGEQTAQAVAEYLRSKP